MAHLTCQHGRRVMVLIAKLVEYQDPITKTFHRNDGSFCAQSHGIAEDEPVLKIGGFWVSPLRVVSHRSEATLKGNLSLSEKARRITEERNTKQRRPRVRGSRRSA